MDGGDGYTMQIYLIATELYIFKRVKWEMLWIFGHHFKNSLRPIIIFPKTDSSVVLLRMLGTMAPVSQRMRGGIGRRKYSQPQGVRTETRQR